MFRDVLFLSYVISCCSSFRWAILQRDTSSFAEVSALRSLDVELCSNRWLRERELWSRA